MVSVADRSSPGERFSFQLRQRKDVECNAVAYVFGPPRRARTAKVVCEEWMRLDRVWCVVAVQSARYARPRVEWSWWREPTMCWREETTASLWKLLHVSFRDTP